MARRKVRGLLGGFLKPVGILLFLIAFFVFYNAYLVDNSLETLKISLEETVKAQSATSIDAVSMLLKNSLMTEASKPTMDVGALAALDLASTIADESRSFRQLRSSQFAIEQVVNSKNENRFILLRWLDQLNWEVQRLIRFVKKIFYEAIKGATQKPQPVSRYDLVAQAKDFEKKGLLESARDSYQSFIRLNANTEGVGLIKTRLAFVQTKLTQYEAARQLLQEVKSSSNMTEVRVAENLLTQIQKLEKLSKDREAFTQKITTVQDPTELQKAYLELGLMSLELYDLKGSQKAFKKAIDMDPNSELAQKARFNLGFAYKLDAKIQESEDIFSAISQNEASDVQLAGAMQLASVKKMQGDFIGATAIMEQLAKSSTNTATTVISQFGAGYIYLYNLNDTKKSQEALERARQIVAFDPRAKIIEIQHFEVLPLREYAFDLFERGKFPEAKDAFRAVLKADKDDAWSHCGLGVIYELEGKKKEGYELVQQGYKLQPDFYTGAALAYVEEKLGHTDKAIELNKKSIKSKSDYLYPYYNLGHIYITQQKYDLATNILKQGRELAVKLGKKVPLLQNNLGLSYFHQKELERAMAMFEEALKIDPNLVEALYNRSLIYEAKGDKGNYDQGIQKVFGLNPQFKDVKQRIAKLAA